MTDTCRYAPEFLAQATHGQLVGQPQGDRVVTDSRLELRDALFVALSGPNFDGHAFVADAIARGASGAMVSQAWFDATPGARTLPLVVVDDPLTGLQSLAGAHRRRFTLNVGAITGSNGKTSTKEFLAAALSPLGPVLRTAGNLNNHIGLPLTLLDLDAHHHAAVVEMGLNHPGELSRLSRLAAPQVAVITSIAAAHLEGLGSLAGVARAKAEIVDGLSPEGVLITPAGIPELEAALANFPGRRITFGLDARADRYPTRVASLGLDGTEITLEGGISIHTPQLGLHVVSNLLAALTAAEQMGVNPEQAASEVESVPAVKGRLQVRRAGTRALLDDTYNANPASLRAALDVLRRQPASARVAVLGDMLELGASAETYHHAVGADAAFVDQLIAVGALGGLIADGALAAGLEPGRVTRVHASREVGDLLKHLPEDAVVLVKGSRGMKLEQAVEAILDSWGGER